MNVLILSKTHMNHGHCCVGGIATDGTYLRLLTKQGENQPEDTDLDIGDIWNIDYVQRHPLEPPHVEDVLVQRRQFRENLDCTEIQDFISELEVPIWNGGPDVLFDEKIKWTENGSGYVDKDDIPKNSVGFWISDYNLSMNIFFEKTRYRCNTTSGWRNLTYVGLKPPVNIIPAGTLIRVSLARWWDTNKTTPLRCSLQLSGWYD